MPFQSQLGRYEQAELYYTLSISHEDLETKTIAIMTYQIKQEIENSISQPRHLLRIVIASIFESERKNPGKLRALYYNTSPTLSVEQIISYSSINQNE
jgi:hypothetical protein